MKAPEVLFSILRSTKTNLLYTVKLLIIMKKILFLTIILFIINISTNAQVTTYNNVSIGTDSPNLGIKIKPNFPGVTGGWARGYHVTNETGDQNYISLGTLGTVTNGVTSVTNSYIGVGHNNQFMTFLPNGNIGIKTSNPQSILQIGDFAKNSANKISIPGTYNFEEIKLGQYGNGQSGLEIITHTNANSSFGVRLYAGTDTGMNGLLFQTADPAASAQNLTYSTKMAIALNGNIGIGIINPANKLDVNGTIHSKEVKVDMNGWSDFVFKKEYNLPTLEEVEKHINEKGHLKDIPSEEEVLKNGISLGEMNTKLLQKIEEMTLYIIEMKKENEKQNKKILSLEKIMKQNE